MANNPIELLQAQVNDIASELFELSHAVYFLRFIGPLAEFTNVYFIHINHLLSQASTQRRNCQRGCSDCVKLPAYEPINEQVDQLQFRRDGGYYLALTT